MSQPEAKDRKANQNSHDGQNDCSTSITLGYLYLLRWFFAIWKDLCRLPSLLLIVKSYSPSW